WRASCPCCARDVERALEMLRQHRFDIVLIGSPFHIQVWKALLRIPAGRTSTYGQVASWAGAPRAYQATGGAIGANPISLLIPCHRATAAPSAPRPPRRSPPPPARPEGTGR
ncbi:MAG: methylated-DNA--[protein]-cysteine S-methyltransferase, partial [Firmicutes bacterium]|nr:methylated-DNA--[protein]-cysteine S-methyltransferase [Bacillota bacterium]